MKELTKKQAEHLKHVGENAKAYIRQRQDRNYAEGVCMLTAFFDGYLSESDIPFTAVSKMIFAICDDYFFKDKEQGNESENRNDQ